MQPLAEPASIAPSASPAFARFLARRAESIRYRIGYLESHGWDLHAVWLLRDDLRRLRDAGRRLGPPIDTQVIDALEEEFDAALAQGVMPDPEASARILGLSRQLGSPDDAAAPGGMTDVGGGVEAAYRESGRIEVPPPNYWRRWVADAPAAKFKVTGVLPAVPPPPSAHEASLHADIDAMINAATSANFVVDVAPAFDVHSGTSAPRVAAATDLTEEEAEKLDHVVRTAKQRSNEDFFAAPIRPANQAEDFQWGSEPAASPAAPLEEISHTDIPIDLGSAQATPEPGPVLEPTVPEPEPVAAQPAPEPPPVSIAPEPVPEPAKPSVAEPSKPRPQSAAATERREVALPDPGQPLRIFHLSSSDELAIELDQRLEQRGHEIELLFSADELTEVLSALLPDVVVIDAIFASDLDVVGEAIREARERAKAPLRLLVMAEADEVSVRLAAKRATVDQLLFGPQSAVDLIRKIENLDAENGGEEKIRVLVVEDDRAQALFAESILRNAGIDVKVALDGTQVIPLLEAFQPELVLMDLHMPDCDGTELTAMIREREEFADTPIVFLSGETDEDKHFEALSAGGDDFLTKPIRPRFLIASVTNRVRRRRVMRARQRASAAHSRIDPVTGLGSQSLLLERIAQALAAPPQARRGGIIHLQLADVDVLRQLHGLTGAEQLFEELARFVIGNLRPGMLACRWGDGSLVIFDPDADADDLRVDSKRLDRKLNEVKFPIGETAVAMNVIAGTAVIDASSADPASVLDMAMRDCLGRSGATSPAAAAEAGKPTDSQDRERQDKVREALRYAMEADGFTLAFQPIVALHGGEDAQYQALLRLRAPDGTVFTAAEVLPVAKSEKLLETLDHWVLNRAMDIIDERQKEQRLVRLFISQAIESLAEQEHGHWLAEEFRLRGLPGHALVIEIDARSVGMHLDTVHNFCATLVPHGIQCCLSYYNGQPEQQGLLQVLPVDLLKLDPALVAQANSSIESRNRLGEVIERAHERGISVIAPRVEDARSAATLWMTGVDFIQGNLVQFAGSGLEFDFRAAVL